MKKTTSPTASSVSAALRRGGLRPIGQEASRRLREGIRISGNAVGVGVSVTADFDSDRLAARLSADAAEVLEAAGYAVERVSPSYFRVAR